MAERPPLSPDDFLLTDRIAIVTGAARGIGAAIATAFARFGAHVAVCDRDEDALRNVASAIEGLGRRTHVGVLDVREPDAVEQWVGEACDSLGPCDALVNNAGGGFFASFLDVNAKGQDALVRENFASVA